MKEEFLALIQYRNWMEKKNANAARFRFVLSHWGVPLLHSSVRSIPKLLPINPSARILDVGCGRGALLRHLLFSLSLSVEPIGFDLARSLLELEVKESKYETRKVNLLEGTATRLPLKIRLLMVYFARMYMIKHLND